MRPSAPPGFCRTKPRSEPRWPCKPPPRMMCGCLPCGCWRWATCCCAPSAASASRPTNAASWPLRPPRCASRWTREPVTITTFDEIAARHGLSAYDAAYLELALRRGLPLATQDDALIAAMAKADVSAALSIAWPPGQPAHLVQAEQALRLQESGASFATASRHRLKRDIAVSGCMDGDAASSPCVLRILAGCGQKGK